MQFQHLSLSVHAVFEKGMCTVKIKSNERAASKRPRMDIMRGIYVLRQLHSRKE